MKIHSMPDYVILIGSDREDNEAVLDNANPNDVWMHLDDHSSAHAVIQTSGRITHKMLKHAARLIKASSKFKRSDDKLSYV